MLTRQAELRNDKISDGGGLETEERAQPPVRAVVRKEKKRKHLSIQLSYVG